ncbi:MAG TPA: DISARM system phospholipase D-like protein DrmC [Polyangiaceae bacterium LLY-WYZ-15_(1-7)]|nr:DISARM system phospholipase D-like protein DrmC [Polyangiaceae bacterium LLY-WYZ-15_(1-7)]HJL01315.1 DISARM system phospholipase D-like protein DrmC [Polyangiaceae bacterium LLY-WYZ-15_(1-7)]HJL13464.1 DISARM system phospholipase D-like protein DrmC [Polyangiaceae bacterium LLY-WYZ-15_(1-7)]HJL24907.1 DISARM system phospholipase D-like protein DrmC [Polyangiaceae bacterium LLY-WYZ-15_(1-7)]HJL33417.1 DISARM system phospholipase D-like protein DrmC [Polyangiaceae bacterium LLY-WYZ-15_(1-7)]
MTDERSSLADVSTSALERLRAAIASKSLDTPVTRTSLVAFGIRHQLDAITDALSGHSRLACLAIVDVALVERAKHSRPSPELVWTGPEGHGATARDTAIVLRGLFESARDHVILGGYSFTHARSVLAPLHATMKERGVRATFFVDIKQPRIATDPPERHAEEALSAFLEANWPFGPPYPALYYDKRAIVPPRPYSILHAKCVVVDAERAFISSANFTMQGQERNIEVGVLLHDSAFARHLAQQWMSLIEAGLVLPASGTLAGRA